MRDDSLHHDKKTGEENSVGGMNEFKKKGSAGLELEKEKKGDGQEPPGGDANVGRNWRGRLPVIVAGAAILAVGGGVVMLGGKQDPNTKGADVEVLDLDFGAKQDDAKKEGGEKANVKVLDLESKATAGVGPGTDGFKAQAAAGAVLEELTSKRAATRVSMTRFKLVHKEPAAAFGGEIGEGSVSAPEMAMIGKVGDESGLSQQQESDGTTVERAVDLTAVLVIRFMGSDDPLPGITVDIVQTDPYGIEKGRHLVWADTPELRRGEGRKVPLTLEVDNYEGGDEFSAEIVEFVPPEKRGEYKEFAGSGG